MNTWGKGKQHQFHGTHRLVDHSGLWGGGGVVPESGVSKPSEHTMGERGFSTDPHSVFIISHGLN